MTETVTLSLDATRDALDRAADAIRATGYKQLKPDRPLPIPPWIHIHRVDRMAWRHAVADAVDQLGDPKTATALREIIRLLEQVGP